MDANVFLGTFNAAESFWYPSPDLSLDSILSRSSTDPCFVLMASFLLCHALSTEGPYIDRCVPFQIMFNQLNLPQVDSNQVVEPSKIFSTRNLNFESRSKGSEYLHKYGISVLFFYTFAKNSEKLFSFVIMWYCV